MEAGADSAAPSLAVNPRPSVGAAQAAAKALEYSGVKGLPVGEGRLTGKEYEFKNPVGAGAEPLRLELMVFPLAPGEARLAWQVYVDAGPKGWWLVLVDAHAGNLLWRSNLESGSGKANVWKLSPVDGQRELVDLPDAWIGSGITVTTNNAVDAYLDRDGNNAPDAITEAGLEKGRASSASQIFDFPAGEGSSGQNPYTFPASSVIHLFYFTNLAHDYFYGLGFNEAAGNFQQDNFGKGGQGGDSLIAEAQDLLVANNANFRPAPDGKRARMQYGIFDQDTRNSRDDRDSALAGQVVFHEYAHGVTTRMVGGPGDVSCLSGLYGRALGEGWSDYFAVSFFNEPRTGRYLLKNQEAGIRRHAYNVHPGKFSNLGDHGFQPHNDGEIWAATLLDLRQKLGAAVADKLVFEALRLTPCNPFLTDARNALVTAEENLYSKQHQRALWEVLAARGLGDSADQWGDTDFDFLTFTAAYDLPASLAGGANRPAKVTTTSQKLPAMGEVFQYQIRARDPEGDALQYAVIVRPPGLTVDAKTGLVRWPATFTGKRAVIAITDAKGARTEHAFWISVMTEFRLDQGLTISGEPHTFGMGMIRVAPNTEAIQVSLRGATQAHEVDLLLVSAKGDFYSSIRLGPNETLTVVNPIGGRWDFAVPALAAYENVTLTVAAPRKTVVEPNKLLANLAGVESSETYFQFTVPEGVTKAVVSTVRVDGEIDLYVSKGKLPTCQYSFLVDAPCEYELRSENLGTAERIDIDKPTPGIYFLDVSADSVYKDLRLIVTFEGIGNGPVVNAGAVGSAANYETILVPGGISSLFGQNLSSGTESAKTLPLPRSMAGVRVEVNGIPAPLFYVSPAQINFQTPVEIDFLDDASVQLFRDGVASAVVPVEVYLSDYGLFTYQRVPGVTDPIVVHADGSLVSPEKPAKPGEVVVAYGTGFGPLSPAPKTGEASPVSPLAEVVEFPDVTLGGKEVKVLFGGLTPGFVGLGQWNLQLPAQFPSAPDGKLQLGFSLFGGLFEQAYPLYVCQGAACQ